MSRRPAVVLITDPAWPIDRVEEVIRLAGARLSERLVVQARDKRGGDHAAALRRLRAATRDVGVSLVVNVHAACPLDVARELGVDGVHVRCDPAAIAEARAALGPTAWISTPAHADEEVVLAASAGADAVLVSPIWPTPGEGKARPRGLDAIVTARGHARDMLVYALGGVVSSRASSCAAAGADGVAVIRALLDAADPAHEAALLAAPFRV